MKIIGEELYDDDFVTPKREVKKAKVAQLSIIGEQLFDDFSKKSPPPRTNVGIQTHYKNIIPLSLATVGPLCLLHNQAEARIYFDYISTDSKYGNMPAWSAYAVDDVTELQFSND